MRMNRRSEAPIILHGKVVEEVNEFSYLGSKMTTDEDTVPRDFNVKVLENPPVDLGPVAQCVDNGIHRVNHYSVDKCWQNKLLYPVDSDLSGG